MAAAHELTYADQPQPRPNLLAYPSPTTSRFIVFLAALLTAGAFVGGWVHNQVLGDEWVSTVARCERQAARPTISGSGVSAEVQQNAAAERCRAAVERRRAAFSFGGALLAGCAGLLVLFAVPAVLERRRRLRQLPATLADVKHRASELTSGLRLTRPPTLMLGPPGLHDAFSYGTPGHYRIALPPAVAVRWRDQTLFDPLVDHELAHIEHRDVALAWLARSVWYALAPLLSLPIVVAVVSGDFSLLPDYLWRAVLLAFTVQLTSAALLRSREHDADLRAAQCETSPGRLAALVARTGHGDAAPRARWRRPLAKHPSAADRLAVLARPELAARVTFVDGLTTGFLAGLSIPVIVTAITILLTGSGRISDARLIAACVTGPMLAGSLGLGLCRASLVNRIAAQLTSLVWPAVGVAAGLVVGEAASLAQTGVASASLHPFSWLPLLALLGAGATVLAGSVAELFADAAPVARRPYASWLPALLVLSLLFSATLWIGTGLQTPLRLGWTGTESWLVTAMHSWLVLSALAVLGLVVVLWAWTTRHARSAPAWILERGDAAPWPAAPRRQLVIALSTGLLAGIVASAVLVAYRIAAGPSATLLIREERYYVFIWLAAAAALGAALPIVLSYVPRGAAIAAVSGTVACLATIAGWLALNVALGSTLSWSFITEVARQPLELSFVAIVVAAPAMLTRRRSIAAPAQWIATALIVLACSGMLIANRGSLLPLGEREALSVPAGGAAAAEAQFYVERFAPQVVSRYGAVGRSVAAIDADLAADGPARALRVTREVLPPLRALLGTVSAYRSTSTSVAAANAACVEALRSSVLAYEMFARAFASGDLNAFSSARAAQGQAQRYWTSWQEQLRALGG